MRDYFLLVHDDATDAAAEGWENYIRALRVAGVFEGGSAISGGMVARKSGTPARLAACLTGFIRVTARDLEHARSFLDGNPVYEAGGTVEIRELTKLPSLALAGRSSIGRKDPRSPVQMRHSRGRSESRFP